MAAAGPTTVQQDGGRAGLRKHVYGALTYGGRMRWPATNLFDLVHHATIASPEWKRYSTMRGGRRARRPVNGVFTALHPHSRAQKCTSCCKLPSVCRAAP